MIPSFSQFNESSKNFYDKLVDEFLTAMDPIVKITDKKFTNEFGGRQRKRYHIVTTNSARINAITSKEFNASMQNVKNALAIGFKYALETKAQYANYTLVEVDYSGGNYVIFWYNREGNYIRYIINTDYQNGKELREDLKFDLPSLRGAKLLSDLGVA